MQRVVIFFQAASQSGRHSGSLLGAGTRLESSRATPRAKESIPFGTSLLQLGCLSPWPLPCSGSSGRGPSTWQCEKRSAALLAARGPTLCGTSNIYHNKYAGTTFNNIKICQKTRAKNNLQLFWRKESSLELLVETNGGTTAVVASDGISCTGQAQVLRCHQQI